MKIYKSTCYLLALLACPTMFCSAPAKAPSQTSQDPDIATRQEITEQLEMCRAMSIVAQINHVLTPAPIAGTLVTYQSLLALKTQLLKTQTSISKLKNDQQREILNASISKQLEKTNLVLKNGDSVLLMIKSRIEEVKATKETKGA